jgi:hypothetical protein
MTLNQVIKRVEQLSLGHKQVRSFRKGLLGDLFADKTAKYPAVCLQDFGGSISLTGHATTLTYKLFFADLVHVNADSKDNEQDVESDMVSIAMDLLAQMNNGNYNDWIVSADNNLQLFVESENDMHAGCVIDLSIRIMFEQNICQIPTDITDYIPTDNDMKFVYDIKYVATGSEGTTLSIPEIVGKKVLFITRESSPLYKVSNSPTGSEYIWNDTVITLGAAVAAPGERYLILFRNY